MSLRLKLSSKPRLLVTGASGFVGRHVVALGRSRYDIVATGREPRPDWLPSDVSWCQVDLLDRTLVAQLPYDSQCTLHLASETVPSKFSGYYPLLDSVEMTLNLCRHLRSGRLLFASSCLVYGESSNLLTENDLLDPRGHYGLTKLLCEQIILRTSGIEAAVARPFNHIGAGMRPDLAIPSIVRRVREAEDGVVIRMRGIDSVRDFLSVEDIVGAYFAILDAPLFQGQIFNVASGRATKISDIVRAVSDLLHKTIGGIEFADQGNSADDTSIMVGDSGKLQRATGWMPHIGLEASLHKLMLDMEA